MECMIEKQVASGTQEWISDSPPDIYYRSPFPISPVECHNNCSGSLYLARLISNFLDVHRGILGFSRRSDQNTRSSKKCSSQASMTLYEMYNDPSVENLIL